MFNLFNVYVLLIITFFCVLREEWYDESNPEAVAFLDGAEYRAMVTAFKLHLSRLHKGLSYDHSMFRHVVTRFSQFR